MRITGWHVDALGALHDVGVEGLPSGVVVLHGPNEAGKSTLLAFLQRTLFGHPHRNRQDVNHYEPRGGGPRGGRVHLLATRADGRTEEITVTRHDGRGLQVLLPDATVGGQHELDELVHGADRRLFNAVFAFDLAELRSIDSLTDESVRDRLFSAGVRGAGRSARAVIDHLDAQARGLWTPRSRTARIDQVQDELAEVGREVDEAVRVAAGYPDRLAREQHLEQELAAADELAEELETAQRRTEALLGAWPVWQRRTTIERELATLQDGPELADDVLEHHERLRTRLEDVEERLARLDEEARSLAERLDACAVDTELLALGDEISALESERSAQLERLDRRATLADERRRISDDLDRAGAALGAAWDPLTEPPLEPSVATRGTLREWQARIERAHRARDEAHRELGARERDRARAADEVDELDRSLAATQPPDAPLPTMEEIERDRERLVQLRVALLQRDAASQAGTATPPGGPAAPAWLVPAVGGAAAVLAVAGVAAASQGATAVLVALVVAATALLLTAAGVRRRAARADAAPRPEASGHTLAGTINRRAVDLGLPTDPSFEDAEQHTLHLEQLRSRRQRADQLREARAHAVERLRGADRAHELASSAHAEAVAEVDDVTRRWRAWCADHGLPADVDPTTVADLLTEWERIVDRRRHLEGLDAEIEALQSAIAHHQDRVAALLARAGRPPTGDGPRDRIGALGRLAEDLAHARERADERRRLQARHAELEPERRRQLERREALRRERAALLADAGAEDEAELREAVERARRRAELAQRRAAAEADLDERLGGGRQAADLREQLAGGDHDGWVATRRRLVQERQELDTARDRVLESLLEARRAREEVETSDRIAELEQRRQALLARRDELVEQWRIARTARRLVAETLEGFERERQPAVLRRAGDHVAQVTDGAYRGLVQRGDELLMQDAQHRARAVDQLSRGTAEQLYLCLRLALAEDLSERGQQLPFVMDDVLVNLDPERRDRLMQLLGRVGRHAQILYFTCHPHMAERLGELASAAVLDLPRGGGPPVPR